MIDAGTYGAPNWVDLSTPDVTAATGFYGDLFGWTVETSKTPMGDYLIGAVDGREVAGMMAHGPELQGMPAVWTVFIYVEDVDQVAAMSKDAGGAVLEVPFDLPDGGGRVGVVADPTGAMLGIISGPRPEGVYFSQRPGAVCWVELLTRDPAAAEGFYAAVFGWKAVTETSGGTAYTMLKLDGDDVAGMMLMPDEVPEEAPSHWAVYFAVADCVASEQRAVELGGHVLRPTTPIGIGSFAVLADPHGATFNLTEFAA